MCVVVVVVVVVVFCVAYNALVSSIRFFREQNTRISFSRVLHLLSHHPIHGLVRIISPHVSFVQLRRPPPPQRITKTDKSQSFTMVLAATLRKFEMPHGRPIAFYVSRNTPSYRMVFDDSPWNSTEVCIFCIAFKHYLLI